MEPRWQMKIPTYLAHIIYDKYKIIEIEFLYVIKKIINK